MATQSIDYPASLIGRKFSWSGIFSGTFLFLAIEATFGVLGVAIFTQAVNPNSPNPIGPGINIGSGVWMIVLTTVALYFAGKLASLQSATTSRDAGMYAGLVTYGMSIFASFLVTATVLGNTFGRHISGAAVGGFTVADFIIIGGFWLFAAMILGMIAAAAGGIHGSRVDRSGRLERTIETKRVA